MTKKLLRAGASVVAFDCLPMLEIDKSFFPHDAREPTLTFYCSDFRLLSPFDLPAPDIIFSQHTLHYLPFQNVLIKLSQILKRTDRCSLYLSFSSLASELAENYPDSPLGPDTSISLPTCNANTTFTTKYACTTSRTPIPSPRL